MKGNRRTLLIAAPGGKGVLLQRTGRGKRTGLRVLFSFTPKVRIGSQLHFHETAVATAKRTYERNFEEALTHALATAR